MSRKIVLTKEQEEWLKENFSTMKNDVIADRLGISLTRLHVFARAMGLTKDPEFMRQLRRENVDKLKEHNQTTSYVHAYLSCKRRYEEYVKSGGKTPWQGFKPGVKNIERLGPEKNAARIKKLQEIRRQQIARDRRRISLGLDPLTNLIRASKFTQWEKDFRSNMKRAGYIIFKNDPVIYYDKDTRRSTRREDAAKKNGMQVVHVSQRVIY